MVKKQSKQSRRWEVEGTVSLYSGILVVLASWPMLHVFYAFFENIKPAVNPGRISLGLAESYAALSVTAVWALVGVLLIGYGVYCYKQMK